MVTLLHQTSAGAVPLQSDLELWTTTHSLTHPVLSDPGQDVAQRWANGQPRYTLLAPGGQIVLEGVGYVSDADIEAVLPLP